MIKASWKKHVLNFKIPGGTSRGVLKEKETYFLIAEKDGIKGIGECGILRGLSYDDRPGYEEKLTWVCENINKGLNELYPALKEWPSIQFGVEQVFQMLEVEGSNVLFKTPFTQGKRGIPVNGLIWMSDKQTMQKQIEQKLEDGYRCIKLKIGAIAWEDEFALLQDLRKRFDALDLEIRVDANGAYNFTMAEKVLDQLAEIEAHSIEQPMKAGMWEEMGALCEDSIVPIALDEELIGITDINKKKKMLEEIAPDYLILKPSFIGGWRGTEEWIELAEKFGVDWWITSALESNVGLNAIAQYTSAKHLRMAQGLGTGGLFTNNIDSPLFIEQAGLWFDTSKTRKTGDDPLFS